MGAIVVALAMVQAMAPEPPAPSDWGNGMIANSASPPAVVVSTPPAAIPRAVPSEPDLGAGRHELVVHWPESAKADYRRAFRTGAGCLKARSAVLDEHRARMAAIAVNMANAGAVLAVELEAPYAVCVPLD